MSYGYYSSSPHCGNTFVVWGKKRFRELRKQLQCLPRDQTQPPTAAACSGADGQNQPKRAQKCLFYVLVLQTVTCARNPRNNKRNVPAAAALQSQPMCAGGNAGSSCSWPGGGCSFCFCSDVPPPPESPSLCFNQAALLFIASF